MISIILFLSSLCLCVSVVQILLQQHIRRLQVAVDDAAGMSRVDGVGESGEQFGGAARRTGLAGEGLGEVAAVD